MHAFKQRPGHLFQSNTSSFFAHNIRSPSLTGLKSRSGSITMDNAGEDLTSFRGHISGDIHNLEMGSAGMPNESYSLLLKKAHEIQSPVSSSGGISPGSENHHLRQTSLGKDFLSRSKSTDHEPKIIITPVGGDRLDQSVDLNSFSARHSLIRSSPFTAKKTSVGKKLSVFLKRRITGDMSETESIESSKHQVEDPLTRRHTATLNRPSRSESGRLLSIIAKQAVIGRNHDVSKVFHLALEKSNSEALRKAKKNLHVDRKKLIIKCLKRVKNRVARIVDPWKPDSFFVIMWKLFTAFIILMHCFFSTYLVCFVPEDQQAFSNSIYLVDFIGDLFYILEILFLFQIGYYYHGELRCERSDIVYHYLTTNFALDVFTMFSLIGRFTDTNWQVLILLTLVRVYKIKPLFAAIEDYLQLSREATSVLRVVKLSGMMIVLAHLCACALKTVTEWESDENNWIVASGLAGESQREIYVTSLYWSVTTMTTVGFGDIAPKTMVERIFVVAVMIVSSIIFGYILSTIGTLLLEVGARSAEAKEKIRILTKYMTEKGLHKDIQSKIRKYLEFYLDRENTAKIEGDYIMKMLSPNLQEELVREVNAKTIHDCYIFSSNFRKRFLYIVSKDMIERSFGPDETIYLRNDFIDQSVYFITSGRVDICYERCGISLQKMKKGACFGYMSFFSGKPRDSTAKSLEFTTVFELNRDKFIGKLENYPSEKETYFMIRDSIVLYNTNQYINLKCYSCGSLQHTVAHCPSLHFTLNKQEVIQEYLDEEKRFSTSFARRPRTKFRALSNLELVQESASQIQMGQQTEVENDMEDNEFTVGGGSYSSIDEIFDRKVYDPKPLDFVADTTHMKYLEFPDGFRYSSAQTLNHIPGSKRMRPKVGEIETFMRDNYDQVHHNLNIDRVKNFEVYYPMNNITKLMVEFEKVRLEKIVQMRLGFKAKHLGPLLVKSFKMHERKTTSNLPSSTPLTKLPSLRTKPIKRHSVNISNIGRRESVAANPSDITLYGSSETHASSFSRFRHQSLLATNSSPLNPPFLLSPTDIKKKKFDPIEFSQKVGKFRDKDKDLSTIREDNTEKFDKGSQSNLSIGTPKASPNGFKHFDFRFQGDSLISKIDFKEANTSSELKTPGKDLLKLETKTFLFSPAARTDPNNTSKNKIEQNSNRRYIPTDSSETSLEAEPSAGTSVDYSKFVHKFPTTDKAMVRTENRGRTDLFKYKSAGPDKDVSVREEGSSLANWKNETSKMFRALLKDRLFETDGNHKRSASEEKGKDILKVMDKYRLPQVFNKMSSHQEEEEQTSGLSIGTSNL